MGLTLPSQGNIASPCDIHNRFIMSVDGIVYGSEKRVINDKDDAENALDDACIAIDLIDDVKAIKDSLIAPSKQFISEVCEVADALIVKLTTAKTNIVEKLDWWKLGTSEVGELRTSNIMAYDKADYVFQVTDVSSIPREFLVVDEKKIKEAMKGGVASIPGLQIVKTTKTILKRVG